jgi:hypothetical protein
MGKSELLGTSTQLFNVGSLACIMNMSFSIVFS